MNNKGFTLTELLVTLVVLAIISAITIPNITGILEDNRINVAIEDANKMYETVKALEATKKEIIPKENNHCTVVSLKYLDKEDNFKTTANSGTYSKETSFVVIKKIQTPQIVKYDYYIRLIEDWESDDKTVSGIDLAKYSELSKGEYKNKSILLKDNNSTELQIDKSSSEITKKQLKEGVTGCVDVDRVYE